MAAKPPFPPIPAGDLPVLRLSQVLDSAQYAAAIPNQGVFEDKGDVFNYYRQGSSLFVPEQHYLAESVTVPEETWPDNLTTYEAYLHCDAYRAASPVIAKTLARSLAQERRFYPNRNSLPLAAATDTHGFGGLWVLEDEAQLEVIIWQGDWVYHLSYSGEEPLEQLIDALSMHIGSGAPRKAAT